MSISPGFPHYYTGTPYPDTRTARARGLPERHGALHIRIIIQNHIPHLPEIPSKSFNPMKPGRT